MPPNRLIELAGDERPAVRDAAIRALGRLDGGEGIPVLLEMLDDARSRIAIYALRKSILEMPAGEAFTILQKVPLTRVTVAKEVIRLLGELQIETAYRQLLAMATGQLHRDLRVALLRAFWGYLEKDQTWPLLEQAALDPDPAIAANAGRIPTNRLSTTAQQRVVRLLNLLLGHPEPRVRTAVLDRCSQLPVSDPGQFLFPALLVALEIPVAGRIPARRSGDYSYL